MLRHSHLRAAAIAALVVPAISLAQAARPTFGISGGAAFPTSDLGDAVNTGYNISAHLGFRPALSPIGLRIEGGYNQFDLKGTGAAANRSYRIVSGTANAVIRAASTPGSMRPYLIGGIGVYNGKVTDFDSETKFGLNGGAGLDLALTGINVFAEARYHYVLTKENGAGANTSFIPLVVGVRF